MVLSKSSTYSVKGNNMKSFSVIVLSGQPDPKNSVCTIQGSLKVIVNDQVVYRCSAFDKYNNQINVSEAARIYNSTFSCSIKYGYMNNTTISTINDVGQDPSNLGYL